MLGDIRPGSLSMQYNVCGNANCRCKHPVNPIKHGPYNKLSYTWRGKNKTVFIKKNQLSDVKKQIKNYKVFRELTSRWVDLSLEIVQLKMKSD